MVVENAACVLQFCKVQFQGLQLQFIPCDIIFQSHSLGVFLIDVADELLREFYVAAEHFLAVGNLLQVKILAQSQETLPLPAQFSSHGSLFRSNLSHSYPSADSTSGINHLLCVKGESVAEMRAFEIFHVGEVTLHEQGIADIACAEACVDFGQPLALCRLYALTGDIDARFLYIQCLVVLLDEREQLAYVHRSCALRMGHRSHGSSQSHRRKQSFQHDIMKLL